MIKVCHMTSAHNQCDVRIFEKECMSLVNAGYEVHLVAPGEDTCINNIKIHGVGKKPDKRLERMTDFAKKVYKEALKVDAQIYHFHDPELLPYGYMLKRQGKKVIFDSHENLFCYISEKQYIPLIIRNMVGLFFLIFLKTICKRFDAIICVDDQICDEYRKLNKNTVRISNFPIYKELNSNRSGDGHTLSFAGGVDDQWNHIAIIKALEMCDEDIKYIICGTTDAAYLERMKALSAWDRVDYKGRVPHDVALQILDRSDVGMALCNYSGNSNGKLGTMGNTKLFEIMMIGIPVICTEFQVWKDIVDEYKCGICVKNPQNSEEIANAIKYLLSRPDENKQMGINGKRAIVEKYNWEVEEMKLLKLYSNMSGELINN